MINTASFRRAVRDIIMSTDKETCANCGKGEEESVSLKNCVACKMVKYCSRDCQKVHRRQHKKDCRKRAAELHDEKLFKHPPQAEDCPICFMRMPLLNTGSKYNACCGKDICSGCIHANIMTKGKNMCPFCRALAPEIDEEVIKRVKKRVEVGDAQAVSELGGIYFEGRFNMPQDRDKALELWHRAGDLGHAKSFHNIGNVYLHGRGVERDEKKATQYWELGAMGGDVHARHNLGCFEENKSNYGRAIKHYMIAVGSGYHDSSKMIKQLYLDGHATRDDYANALQAYQAYLEEIKSDDRDKAAAFSDGFKYYE